MPFDYLSTLSGQPSSVTLDQIVAETDDDGSIEFFVDKYQAAFRRRMNKFIPMEMLRIRSSPCNEVGLQRDILKYLRGPRNSMPDIELGDNSDNENTKRSRGSNLKAHNELVPLDGEAMNQISMWLGKFLCINPNERPNVGEICPYLEQQLNQPATSLIKPEQSSTTAKSLNESKVSTPLHTKANEDTTQNKISVGLGIDEDTSVIDRVSIVHTSSNESDKSARSQSSNIRRISAESLIVSRTVSAEKSPKEVATERSRFHNHTLNMSKYIKSTVVEQSNGSTEL